MASRLHASQRRVPAVLAVALALLVAASVQVVRAQVAPPRGQLPGPDPNFAHTLAPSPCTPDPGNSYEKDLFKQQGWSGPDYARYPGACQRLHFAIGPIAVKPGQNDVLLQPLTYEKPAYDGFIVRFKPNLVRADGSVPPIEQIHLHHAVWFTVAGGAGQGSTSTGGGGPAGSGQPELDFRNYGNGPFAASGEEKTIFNVPRGYGFPILATDQWNLLHMVHNQRAQADVVWITYDVDYVARDAGLRLGLRPVYPIWLDVRPSIYPVFNVERKYATPDPVTHRLYCTWPMQQTAGLNPWGDLETGQGLAGNNVGTPVRFPARGQPLGRIPSFTGGTLVEVAGHLHPGGVSVNIDLQRAAQRQRIFTSEAHYWDWRHPSREGGPPTSWDMSMSLTQLPRWGVHVQPGDTIWMNATYDATDLSTYEDMGIAVAFIAPDGPGGPSAPNLDPFTASRDQTETCQSGGLAASPPRLCDKGFVSHGHMAEADHHGGPGGTLSARPGPTVSQVNIAGFQYLPGDQGSTGIPTVPLGGSLTFNDLDAAADVYHSVTACAYPCTGATGIAFPLSTGVSAKGAHVDFDSGELGYGVAIGRDFIGPAKNKLSWTLAIDPAQGFRAGATYTYFCRVHPFMRGAFAVAATGGGSAGGGSGPASGPAGPAPPRAGGDWRTFGHDLSNTRAQDQEHIIGPANAARLAPAWTFSSQGAGADGDFTGTPIVADGYVLAGSNQGWVFALNADTGQPAWKTHLGGKIPSSLGVDHGVVFAAVGSGSAVTGAGSGGHPFLAALEEATGKVLWSTVLDTQAGADVYASPIVFDGTVIIGVSGGAAELGPTAERYPFHGSISFVEETTGKVLRKTWSIPEDQWSKGYAGAGVWSTPAIDTVHKVAFVGTGNPFQPGKHAPTSDAILRLDLDRTHATFGQMIGYYQGTPETYINAENAPCVTHPGNPPPYYPQGVGSCGDIDLDFGAAANLFRSGGRLLVGEGQKSGVYHVIDPTTMKKVWTTVVGPASDVGGVVGSTAFDGRSVYGPITSPGYVWSVDATSGAMRWISPTADGLHYGEPVTVANGVVYTVDFAGFMDAYEAATGIPLMHRPLALGSATGLNPALSWGGVSVARNTVYAAVGTSALGNGFIVAFRLGGAPAGGGPPGGAPPGRPAPPAPSLPTGPTVVAGPGAYATVYATPVMTVPAGGTLSFTNLDVAQHDVTAAATGADGAPLFGSRLVGLGETVPVNGVARLKPGSYAFYCSIHPGMRGTLLVA
jgi:outer membrane protein assembly factor BamB/plastocyanin